MNEQNERNEREGKEERKEIAERKKRCNGFRARLADPTIGRPSSGAKPDNWPNNWVPVFRHLLSCLTAAVGSLGAKKIPTIGVDIGVRNNWVCANLVQRPPTSKTF